MENRIAQLSALAHAQRLAVFRLLVRHYPRPLPAGEIGTVLGFKPSTLSAYLSALTDAGLIDQQRRGASLLYRADIDGARALTGFLVDDCCHARTRPQESERSDERIHNVLFLCSANSARSLMAEAIQRDQAGDRFEVFSAGTEAAARPDPRALELLGARGHDTDSLWSKSADLFRAADAPRMDFVVSVCDRSANIDERPWPGAPVQAHWPVPDPVAQDMQGAFDGAYDALRRSITEFADLPALPRHAMQDALDVIAEHNLKSQGKTT